MAETLAIAIPTCSRQAEDIRIGYVLEALALQPPSEFYDGLDIYIRDEGPVPMTRDRWAQLVVDLSIRRGHRVTYLRRTPSRGVAAARKELLDEIPPHHNRVLFVDDDLLVMPGALDSLLRTASEIKDYGFVQGSKVELDEKREYHNDINCLTGCPGSVPPERIWFGDAAFLLFRRQALRHVRWEIVTRFAEEGLPGEDVAITLMIADRLPCYGDPSATGYHMSLTVPRWKWEVPSDLLQLELLRSVVSAETLQRALPHLARYTAASVGGVADGGNESASKRRSAE